MATLHLGYPIFLRTITAALFLYGMVCTDLDHQVHRQYSMGYSLQSEPYLVAYGMEIKKYMLLSY